MARKRGVEGSKEEIEGAMRQEGWRPVDATLAATPDEPEAAPQLPPEPEYAEEATPMLAVQLGVPVEQTSTIYGVATGAGTLEIEMPGTHEVGEDIQPGQPGNERGNYPIPHPNGTLGIGVFFRYFVRHRESGLICGMRERFVPWDKIVYVDRVKRAARPVADDELLVVLTSSRPAPVAAGLPVPPRVESPAPVAESSAAATDPRAREAALLQGWATGQSPAVPQSRGVESRSQDVPEPDFRGLMQPATGPRAR